jgi:putative nucleotidyltransferase with HDIG domain
MSSVRALARAIDSKDSSTAQHSERVALNARELALALGWTQKRAELLHACGLLHDVGKIGIPDSILLRPGPLGADEYEQIKRHAEVSAQIAAEVLEDEQVSWIRGHHERWDGAGYPDQLRGDEIPDGAQLLALADAWDVMTQSRTYQQPKTIAEALADVREQSGHQFAPNAVRALVHVMDAAALQILNP